METYFIYDNYSFFYSFFFIIILVFFLVLIFLPRLRRIDIVPPLSDNNYRIKLNGFSDAAQVQSKTTLTRDIKFYPLQIKDGSGSGTSALNFGNDDDSVDITDIAFATNYEEAYKNISGFFSLDFSVDSTSGQSYLIYLRVVDSNNDSQSGSTLKGSNNGWSDVFVKYIENSTLAQPIRTCQVPFNIEKGSKPHLLQVQAGIRQTEETSQTINSIIPELRSAYLYYYTF